MRSVRLSVLFLLSLCLSLLSCCDLNASKNTTSGIDLVLVLDVSGSMKHSDPDHRCTQAALSLIQDLAKIPSSRVAITAFSDQLELSSTLTSLDTPAGLSAVSDCLQAVRYTRGDTDIGLAIQHAADLLLQEPDPDRARCILLLTDGEIDLPSAADEEKAENESLTKVLVAVEDCAASGTVIHTVMLDPTGGLDPSLCRYMADRTGGSSVITADPSSIPGLFGTIRDYALSQAAALSRSETEAKTAAPADNETEAETEPQTEAAAETETAPSPVIVQTGTIDSPVILKALVPGMCRACVDLSGVFQYESPDGLAEDASQCLQFSARATDPSCLQCTVEGQMLQLTGKARGKCTVTVYAQGTGTLEEVRCGPIRFEVSVRPYFSSAKIPVLAAVLLFAGIAALLFALRFLTKHSLTGSLQWYIRTDGQKIFGVPSQTRARLDGYGKKVVLSQLVEDDLLEDADLSRVKITGISSGIRISSRSGNILLADSEGACYRSVDLDETSDIRILCRTQSGSVSIMARYLAPEEDPGDKDADASDERTRMLIHDDYRMAG